jgi:hypothetical protein
MRALLLALFAFALLALAVAACGSSFPRDLHYGTDAGADFQPPMWDAPSVLPDGSEEVDAATD